MVGRNALTSLNTKCVMKAAVTVRSTAKLVDGVGFHRAQCHVAQDAILALAPSLSNLRMAAQHAQCWQNLRRVPTSCFVPSIASGANGLPGAIAQLLVELAVKQERLVLLNTHISEANLAMGSLPSLVATAATPHALLTASWVLGIALPLAV